MPSKERRGNYFEDFRLGQVIRHGTPRTVTDGDSAVYIALTGARHASHSADTAARQLGFPGRPLDDLLVFNIAFGKNRIRDLAERGGQPWLCRVALPRAGICGRYAALRKRGDWPERKLQPQDRCRVCEIDVL